MNDRCANVVARCCTPLRLSPAAPVISPPRSALSRVPSTYSPTPSGTRRPCQSTTATRQGQRPPRRPRARGSRPQLRKTPPLRRRRCRCRTRRRPRCPLRPAPPCAAALSARARGGCRRTWRSPPPGQRPHSLRCLPRDATCGRGGEVRATSQCAGGHRLADAARARTPRPSLYCTWRSNAAPAGREGTGGERRRCQARQGVAGGATRHPYPAAVAA